MDWEITKAAELLAGLAAVLSAFVFGSLAVLLSTPPNGDSQVTRHEESFSFVVYLLLVVFLALISTTFFFAVLAAIQEERSPVNAARATLSGVVASYGFWMSVELMALSVIWLCKEYRVSERVLRRLHVLFGIMALSVALSVSGTIVQAVSQSTIISKAVSGAIVDQQPDFGRYGAIIAGGVIVLFLLPWVGSWLIRRVHGGTFSLRVLEIAILSAFFFMIVTGMAYAFVLVFLTIPAGEPVLPGDAGFVHIVNWVIFLPAVLLAVIFGCCWCSLPDHIHDSGGQEGRRLAEGKLTR